MFAELGSDSGFQVPDLIGFCQSCWERSPLPTLAVEGEAHLVCYVNPSFCRLVGKDSQELIGRPYEVAVPEGQGNECLSLLAEVYRTGMPGTLPEQEHRHTSPAFWSYAMWANRGADDRPAAVIIQVTDSTEIAIFRRRATAANESLLISSIRQYDLAEEAKDLNARLRTANDHKDHFIAVLSHELRTPLTPVLAAISLLQRDNHLDNETRAIVAMIHRNIILEARLIDDLLDMARSGRDQLHLVRHAVDIRLVVERAIEVCKPDMEARALALDVDLTDGPILVEADADRLQQVFWNLLRNAIKFSTAGGRLGIRCRRHGDSSVIIEVSDVGAGIDSELLPRLFNAFRQRDREQSRAFGGLGLGLAISKTIVDLHGGTITARSSGKGLGASFFVSLPIMAGVPSVALESGWPRRPRYDPCDPCESCWWKITATAARPCASS